MEANRLAFGLFIHRSDSIYDDSPADRYQFPRQYLGRVQAFVQDWIIYYEPKDVAETRGYFAVAKVERVIPDPALPGMYVACIAPGSYLDFATPVPFNGPQGVNERGVLGADGRLSGRVQSAVRPISPADFRRIVEVGLDERGCFLSRIDAAYQPSELSEDQAPFQFEQDRLRTDFLGSRALRDRVFRQVVLRAYQARCAMTGLRLINGGGRAEVEAAHIRPVEANGPDIVNNGIALSGTAHWMFDRGLIGISDDLQILISRHVNDPNAISAMINRTRRILLPARETEQPHPQFLQWHRQNCFKA
jgi:putative restriction endonuclease